MSTLSVTLSHFKELHLKGYSLDYIYILQLAEKGEDLNNLTDSLKIQAIIKAVERRGLLSSEGKLTLDGKKLLAFLNSEEGEKIAKKEPIENEFELFWKAFPPTDNFTYKGIKFAGSRALRINKDGCKTKLRAILNEGERSIQEIVSAIEYDVLGKMENSIKTKTNKLSYMQNSLTYLNQRSYDPFIDLIKEGHKIKEEQIITGGTDV